MASAARRSRFLAEHATALAGGLLRRELSRISAPTGLSGLRSVGPATVSRTATPVPGVPRRGAPADRRSTPQPRGRPLRRNHCSALMPPCAHSRSRTTACHPNYLTRHPPDIRLQVGVITRLVIGDEAGHGTPVGLRLLPPMDPGLRSFPRPWDAGGAVTGRGEPPRPAPHRLSVASAPLVTVGAAAATVTSSR